MEAPNFPKKEEGYGIFLRGSGKDANSKSLTIKGLKMYSQNFWIDGTYLLELLSQIILCSLILRKHLLIFSIA